MYPSSISSGNKKKAPKYAKFDVALITIGIKKLRFEKYDAGISGFFEVRIVWTKITRETTQATNAASTQIEVHPSIGAIESPSINAVTPTERLVEPTQSISLKLTLAFARPAAISSGVPRCAGRITATTQNAMIKSTSWAQNRARQPKNWMMGDPSETPMTGPPAPTKVHHPIAFTRSAGPNAFMMRAIDAVPVAAPWMPSSVRAPRSMSTLGAIAVKTADTIAPASPKR